MNTLLKKVGLLVFASLLVLQMFAQPVIAEGKFRKYLNMGISYYDPDCSVEDSGSDTTSNDTTGATVSPTYILGDSITAGAEGQIKDAFKGANINITSINADPGRAISSDTSGNQPSGLEAVKKDSKKIANSKSVIIALGTNSGVEDLDEQIPALIKAVKAAHPDEGLTIFWVNVFSEGKSPHKVDKEGINKSIEKNAASQGYTVLDVDKAKIEVGGDNTHPTAKGSKQFAKAIVDALPKDGGSSGSGSGGFSGKTDYEKVYNYLISLGAEPKAAAGLVGNFAFESGGQDVELKTEKFNTRADQGQHIGLAQWDKGDRWPSMQAFATKKGKSPFDLKTEVEFVISELKGEQPFRNISLSDLNKAGTPTEAAHLVNDKYEITGRQEGRAQTAENLYKKYGEGGGTVEGGGNPQENDTPKDGVCCITNNADGSNELSESGSSTGDRSNYMYHSGLPGADGHGKGTFILEQWAIHTLKSIAQLKNVPESSTVTQNHVVSLVAFAKGEGGDIANQWQFNPLNSGFPGDLYVDGAHAGNGTQSFKSFDAGVSATSRHMTEGYQSRLGDVLIKPNSTNEDFINTLTHPDKTKGNLYWAEASDPSSPYYRSDYIPYEQNLVKQVRANYKNIASITIGTPNFKDELENSHKPDLIQYTDLGGVTEGTSDPSVSGATQCCNTDTTGGINSVAGSSDPSEWKQIYKTNKSVSDAMDHGPMDKPKALIIHYTEGDAEGVNLFTGMAPQGVQFNVGKTGTVYQAFPLDNMRASQHVANFNSNAIGIEITAKNADELINNDQQFQSVVKLSSFLCDKYNIPCSNPKGDITNSSIDQAQGMLGHDEVPTNDHQDPDFNPGERQDRKDSSKHKYMIKLRTAMGFEPTPGKSGGSATPATGSTSSSDPSGAGAGNGSGVSCGDKNTEPTGSANLTKTITVKEGAKYITLPSKYSCPGRTTQIDARIAASLAYLLTTYNMCADDGLANGHKSHGAGLGVDIRPKDQSKQMSKDEWNKTAGALLKDINWWGDASDEPKSSKGCAKYTPGGYGQCVAGAEGPSGKIPTWMRWIGYNGDVDHGDPWHVYGGSYAHIHLGWDSPNHSDAVSPSITSPAESVYTFPAPVPDDINRLLPDELKSKD